jgi:serine/threonine protein kinase
MSGQEISSPKIGTRPSARSLGSTEEAQMLEAVEEYRAAMQNGRPASREEFLRRYPAIAPSLSAALDGLEFIEQVAPQLSSGVATPAGSSVINPTAALGDFRIVRQLGRGGMGVVYEAEQLSLGRRVALKVLPFAAMLDEKQLKRFQNEARAAATLDHPNIVSVYSVGTERGVHYYAMQLIEGQSMAEVIDELRRANADPEPALAARWG